jgi:hypothetical protein
VLRAQLLVVVVVVLVQHLPVNVPPLPGQPVQGGIGKNPGPQESVTNEHTLLTAVYVLLFETGVLSSGQRHGVVVVLVVVVVVVVVSQITQAGALPVQAAPGCGVNQGAGTPGATQPH